MSSSSSSDGDNSSSSSESINNFSSSSSSSAVITRNGYIDGISTPSYNGDYIEDGLYNGYMSYKHVTENYYIYYVFYTAMFDTYWISATKGSEGTDETFYRSSTTNPFGTYTPALGSSATGTQTFHSA